MRQDLPKVAWVSTIASISCSVGVCSYDAGQVVQNITRYLCGNQLELEQLQQSTFTSPQFEGISCSTSIDEAATKSSTQLPDAKDDEMTDVVKNVPLPHILVSHIDGMEVHTEARERSHDDMNQSQPIGSLLYDNHIHQGPGSDSNHQSLIDPSTQSQYVSPSHLENTPSQVFQELRETIWAHSTPEQEKIAALESDLERIMLRFDDIREECRLLAEHKDEAQAQATALQKRFERTLEEARAARSDKNDLKLELDRLKLPALPDESSPEYLMAVNTRLHSELEKAKKSSESKVQDFEFVRQQYQQSSAVAAELATENEGLKAKIVLLENRVTGGEGHTSVIKQGAAVLQSLEEDVENLTLRNNILIEQLRRMRDDRMASRGRGETRRDTSLQVRKRAASASDLGQRKKLEKLGASRLSVASLISPMTGWDTRPALKQEDHTQRGKVYEPANLLRDCERSMPKRSRTPF